MAEDQLTIAAPRLQTPRTVMRPHRLEDFEASAAMWADPEVVRYITGKPSTREESWRRLNRHVGHWCLLGYGFWVVEDRETGAYLGEVGFADFLRDIQPPLVGIPEIGWVLPRSAHGRGLATETVAAAIEWGERFADSLPPDRTTVTLTHLGPESRQLALQAEGPRARALVGRIKHKV